MPMRYCKLLLFFQINILPYSVSYFRAHMDWPTVNGSLAYIPFLTPRAQRSERNLPDTIVPWRDNFDKWLNDFQINKSPCIILKLGFPHAQRKNLHLKFPAYPSPEFVQINLTSVLIPIVPSRVNCAWGVKYWKGRVTSDLGNAYETEFICNKLPIGYWQ